MDTYQEKRRPGIEPSKVREMFNLVSGRYDLLNHVLSAGEDIRWRRFTAKRIPPDSRLILDLAVGTADMAVAIKRRNPAQKVIGIDFADDMMRIGVKKASRKGFAKDIHFINGDGLTLPFPDKTFDAVTIAFGLRNFSDRRRGLKEMARVTKNGGKIFVLEMTLPRNGVANRFFHWYLRNVIPIIGRALSCNKSAYSYLSSSIEKFLTPEELKGLFQKAGLLDIKAHPLSFGITYLHEGTVP